MSILSESQVDNLLREAEERLRNDLTSKPQMPASRLVVTQDDELNQSQRKKDALSVRTPQSSTRHEKTNDDAGKAWFNLPKTDMTPEFKRDWQILRMRSILDPKHQKKALKVEPPKYSQLGELVAGPADHSRRRLTRKEKGKTMLEEAMRASNKEKLRTKYAGIQKVKTSGKKAFYQKLVRHRRKGA